MTDIAADDAISPISATEAKRAAATIAAENVAKHIAENVAESLGAMEAAAAGRRIAARIDPGVPVLIVDRALLRVGQYLVGLLGFFEFLLGFPCVYK